MSATTAPHTTTSAGAALDTADDAALQSVVYTMAMRKIQYPQLVHTEAQARLKLAAAIAAMDEAEDRIEMGMAIHSLNEQAAVEQAKDAYGQALADLMRGQASSCKG